MKSVILTQNCSRRYPRYCRSEESAHPEGFAGPRSEQLMRTGLIPTK